MDLNSKIYIAGHQGMVGSAVTKKFKKENFCNLILKNRQELDLFDQNAVRNFFENEKPEYVIICAAKVGGIKANMSYPADFLNENMQIQNNIIWQAHLSNVKKLLFLGSSCIYPRNCPQPMREEYLMNGNVESTNEGYSIAKIAGLKLCEKIFEQYKQTFISCMPTNIYGENDNFDLDSSHVVPALIRKIHNAKTNNLSNVEIWGSGNSKRELMHVEDLAGAIFFLMQNYNDKQFLNIGTGEDLSIKELALLVKNIVGFEGKLIFDTTKPDGMPKKLLDVSKINMLGWRYKISLIDGLKMTYGYYLKSILLNK